MSAHDCLNVYQSTTFFLLQIMNTSLFYNSIEAIYVSSSKHTEGNTMNMMFKLKIHSSGNPN